MVQYRWAGAWILEPGGHAADGLREQTPRALSGGTALTTSQGSWDNEDPKPRKRQAPQVLPLLLVR